MTNGDMRKVDEALLISIGLKRKVRVPLTFLCIKERAGGTIYEKKKKEYILITIGTIFVALATKFFLAPNRIAAGGVIGLAIIINKFIPYLNLGFYLY